MWGQTLPSFAFSPQAHDIIGGLAGELCLPLGHA